jgi:carboxypeptidase Taq
MTAYQQLEARFRRIGALEEAVSVLNWDAAAMMPMGGGRARSEQMAHLRVVAHQHLVDPEIGELLAASEAERAGLGPWQQANLREIRRRRAHAAALPEPLVEAMSRAASECETIWRRAHPENDFTAVLPCLERVLTLKREAAAAKADALATTPYDALLDQHEPGLKTARIDRLFDEIAGFLPDLLDDVLAYQASLPAVAEPAGPFPIETQRRVAMTLMQRIGFDFEHGRLDVSAHPFCGGTPEDVRITTRYSEDDFGRALMGVLHETGHALYQRGLPAEWRLQPVGRARGMAVHESQSLFLEMQICRSPAFMAFAAPILREAFAGDGPAWTPQALHRRQTRVARSLIRVDADEVTYPAHVILRYRLERAMIAGELAPADLPAAWAEGLRGLIGIAPNSDREGCLQDIHWYEGLFGYFPTYTLGALIAAQLFETIAAEIPEIMDAIATGEFAPLLGWLRARIHARASLLPSEALIAEATGRPLDADSFERHLRRRYLG